MISADVKANKNNKKQKIWGVYLTSFYKMYVQSKHEIQYKRGMYFSSDFSWYSIHFDIVRSEQGQWRGAGGGWVA